MTTTVTIKTAQWPAKVSTFPLRDREPIEGTAPLTFVVQPYSEQSFVVHDGQDLAIHELPEPKTS